MISVVVSPLQKIKSFTASISAAGFTVIVYNTGLPSQAPAEVVTAVALKIKSTGIVPELLRSKEGITTVPLTVVIPVIVGYRVGSIVHEISTGAVSESKFT